MDYSQEVKINFSLQLQTLQVFKKELPTLVLNIYNSLPSNILNLKNDKKQFKNELYRYLLNKSFYSVKEFLEFSRDN